LNSKARFSKFKYLLEQTERYQIKFAYGGTATQRRNFIRERLVFDKSILDVGCGEGAYALPFAKKIENHHYYAIDIDPTVLEIVEKKANRREIENIVLHSSLDDFLTNYNNEVVDIILTEVIEHMPQALAEDLIKTLLTNVDFATFIITTPDAGFNQFYELTDKFRHDDHDWEMNRTEFQSWMKTILDDPLYEYQFIQIGDMVNGISTSQGVMINKIKKVGEENGN
jgi:SAM-dependent methyltransferase